MSDIEIDYSKFVDEHGIAITGGSHEVYYNGSQIGEIHSAGASYGYTVRTGKWHCSYQSCKTALRELFIRATTKQVSIGDVFPKDTYILRLAEAALVFRDDPKFKPFVRCRLFYNSVLSNGQSIASKPATATPASIDLDARTITLDGKKQKTFANQDEIFTQLDAMLSVAMKAI